MSENKPKTTVETDYKITWKYEEGSFKYCFLLSLDSNNTCSRLDEELLEYTDEGVLKYARWYIKMKNKACRPYEHRRVLLRIEKLIQQKIYTILDESEKIPTK